MGLLKQDLEHLARDRRQDQPLPTAEQLVALRDGRLDEQHADELRLQMAADPALAEVYLRLCRADEDVEISSVPEEQIAQGLQDLTDRVGAEASGSLIPWRRRPLAWAGWAAVAATLLVVFALRMQQPDGPYLAVQLSDVLRSDEVIEIPADHSGVELILNPVFLQSKGFSGAPAMDLRLETVQGKAVAEAFGILTSDLPSSLKVHRRKLIDGRNYVLKLRESGQGSWPREGRTFELKLVPPPPAP